MDSFPPVSVIIPAFNSERFLESALDSVFHQTYPGDLQVIVIDDGSTDGTSTIAKQYPGVDYRYQENRGVSSARNAGIKIAHGKYITFLDSDDIWDPEKLSEQISFMEKHQEIDVTGSFAENFLEADTELPQSLRKKGDWKKMDTYIIPSTMVVRRGLFDEIGGFDEAMQSGEDTDWLWRAQEAGTKSYILEKYLVRRRFHGENLSWKHEGEIPNRLLWIARKSIRRSQGKNKS